MGLRDRANLLRLRDLARGDEARRHTPESTGGTPCLVARTKSLGAYPTQASRYFACTPQTVLGMEVEDGSGTLSSDEATFFALNLGAAVPPVSTAVLVTFTGNRWVFRYDG